MEFHDSYSTHSEKLKISDNKITIPLLHRKTPLDNPVF